MEDVSKLNFEVLIQLSNNYFLLQNLKNNSFSDQTLFIKNTNLSKVGIFRDVLPWIIFSIGVGSGKSEKLFICANSPTLLLWTVSCLVAKKSQPFTQDCWFLANSKFGCKIQSGISKVFLVYKIWKSFLVLFLPLFLPQKHTKISTAPKEVHVY